MLLVRNPGGIQIANFTVQAGTNAIKHCRQAWDDYQEHDITNEAVKIHKIRLQQTPENLATYMANVTDNMNLVMGFHPGNVAPASLTVVPDESNKEKYLTTNINTRHIVAAASNEWWDGIVGEMSFVDIPLVADPVTNDFVTWIESSDAGNVFADGYLVWTVWYQWIKADKNALQAYLNWEALGA